MTSIPIICNNCKKEFYKPEKLIIKRNFCCKECFFEFKRAHPQYYGKGNYTGAMNKLLAYAELRKQNLEVKGR